MAGFLPPPGSVTGCGPHWGGGDLRPGGSAQLGQCPRGWLADHTLGGDLGGTWRKWAGGQNQAMRVRPHEMTGTGCSGEPGLGLDPGQLKLEQCWRGEACELSQPEGPG